MQAKIETGLDTRDDAVVVAIARANPGWEIEIGPVGEVRLSPLTGTAGGAKEGEAFLQLAAWARSAGGRAFPASTGFRMPDLSVVGPDAAWVSPAQLRTLTLERREAAFWAICPAVVVEILGDWSSWPELRSKIGRYASYGAAYAIAIRPDTRETYALGEPPSGLRLAVTAICAA